MICAISSTSNLGARIEHAIASSFAKPGEGLGWTRSVGLSYAISPSGEMRLFGQSCPVHQVYWDSSFMNISRQVKSGVEDKSSSRFFPPEAGITSWGARGAHLCQWGTCAASSVVRCERGKLAATGSAMSAPKRIAMHSICSSRYSARLKRDGRVCTGHSRAERRQDFLLPRLCILLRPPSPHVYLP